MKSKGRSRLGRHTAAASTWLLRFDLYKTRTQAVKAVQRGKVKIRGVVAKTGLAYTKPDVKDIEIEGVGWGHTILKNRKKYMDNYRPFQRTFGANLKQYFDFIYGFDIIRFDDLIVKSKPNKSVSQTVRAKYGKGGVKIITNLLA